MLQMFRAFLRDDEGQDMAEYALLVALIAIVIAVAIPTLTTAIENVFNDAANCLNAPGTAC
jgi:pilus assembly protein Flp/PilA